jgi:CubicO group peptidase (beta-lactamase class C family)
MRSFKGSTASIIGAAVLALLLPSTFARTAAATAPPIVRSPAAHELSRSDLEAWLDGFLPYSLQAGDIAGAVVLVVKDGAVLLQKGYGYADIAGKVAMDSRRTIVGVGSVSKLFTWTAVMQLVEQGKLDLDRDVNAYLDVKIPPAFGKPITMRNLMTHTAGFEERLKEYLTRESNPHSLSTYITTIPAPARIYPPGAVPAYSNYGADLAGYIVERLSGERFETYIAQHILRPLGMDHSAFCKPPPIEMRANLAQSYRLASSGEVLPPSANIRDPRCSPAGDLASSADDMSHFMLAHLQRGQYEGVQILRPETADQMHTTTFTPLPGALGTTLGFFHNDMNGYRVIAHDGDLSGFHSDVELLPDNGVGFFLSVNSDGAGTVLGDAYKLRASVFHQFMDRYFPGPALTTEPALATAKQHARLAAGEYQMTRRPSGDFMCAIYLLLHVSITANADGTIKTPGLLSLQTGRSQTWREVAPFLWREVGGSERLFMKVRDNHVEELVPGSLVSFVLQPVPFLLSAEFNLPLLAAAAIVLTLTTLGWPICSFARKRQGLKPKLQTRAVQIRRLTRVGAAAGTAFLLAWTVLIVAASDGAVSFDIGLDRWIRAIQFLGCLCAAGAGIAVWNIRHTWVGRGGWLARAFSVLLALALLYLVWFSFAFHLISANLNY